MSAVCLSVVTGRGVMGNPIKHSFLYATMEEAKEVFDRMVQAAKDWDSRTNDRERFFTFTYMHGEGSICISEAMSMEIENPFGEHAEILEDWNIRIGRLQAMANPKPGIMPL